MPTLAGPLSSIAASRAGELESLLTGAGLYLDYGTAGVCVRSPLRSLARQIAAVYPEFPLQPAPAFCDFHVRLDPARGWRRWVRPQVVFTSDGEQRLYPFPSDTALPLLEWGTNWLIGQRLHHRLLFHAGALERDGRGLLLPATPGSGKSTLTAALSLRGWRLLSDEFGVCDPETGGLAALLKPIALKNESIDVIRALSPKAVLGPSFPHTRKGTVAHMAASADAFRRRHQTATPSAVLLPRWRAGATTTLVPLDEEEVFRALAFNSFNYAVLGEVGFRAVIRIVRRCRGWRLIYSDLDDAVRALEQIWRDSAEADVAASGFADATEQHAGIAS